MGKFPIDAPIQKVKNTFELLGFRTIREKKHLSMERTNPDGTKTPLTMPNHFTPAGINIGGMAIQLRRFILKNFVSIQGLIPFPRHLS
ncbi:MAG: type II toxin-antitoxin system HicA family toxin [Pseudomonadota bacterium]